MLQTSKSNSLCLGESSAFKPQLAVVDEQNAKQRSALRKLMRNVIAELCLGTIIVLIVGALGATPPPRHRM